VTNHESVLLTLAEGTGGIGKRRNASTAWPRFWASALLLWRKACRCLILFLSEENPSVRAAGGLSGSGVCLLVNVAWSAAQREARCPLSRTLPRFVAEGGAERPVYAASSEGIRDGIRILLLARWHYGSAASEPGKLPTRQGTQAFPHAG
jgi:hypothetical protein